LAQAARVEEVAVDKPPPDNRRQADKARCRLEAKAIRLQGLPLTFPLPVVVPERPPAASVMIGLVRPSATRQRRFCADWCGFVRSCADW